MTSYQHTLQTDHSTEMQTLMALDRRVRQGDYCEQVHALVSLQPLLQSSETAATTAAKIADYWQLSNQIRVFLCRISSVNTSTDDASSASDSIDDVSTNSAGIYSLLLHRLTTILDTNDPVARALAFTALTKIPLSHSDAHLHLRVLRTLSDTSLEPIETAAAVACAVKLASCDAFASAAIRAIPQIVEKWRIFFLPSFS